MPQKSPRSPSKEKHPPLEGDLAVAADGKDAGTWSSVGKGAPGPKTSPRPPKRPASHSGLNEEDRPTAFTNLVLLMHSRTNAVPTGPRLRGFLAVSWAKVEE